MDNRIKIGLVTVFLVCSFFFGRCTKECDTEIIRTTIVTPEKKGSFESPQILKPESSDIKTIIKIRDSIITIPQVNEELVQKYLALQEENDLTKRENLQLKLYTDAVSINTYKTNFNNKDIDLTITSKVQGKLLEVKPEYTIKPQSFETDIKVPKDKERVLSFNIGGGLSTTKTLNKFEPSVNLDIIGKKNNVLSLGYGTEGTITAKYSINLFNIKK